MNYKKFISLLIIAGAFLIVFTGVSAATDSRGYEPNRTSLGTGIPDVSGDVLVNTYKSSETSKSQVQVVNLTTQTVVNTPGLANPNRDQWGPKISGNYIVFNEYVSNSNRDIYMYDLSTKTKKVISSNVNDAFNLEIYGNILVWTDTRNNIASGTDIYYYNLSNGSWGNLTPNNTKWQYSPSIYGTKVVYLEWAKTEIIGNKIQHSDGNIIMYDISTGVRTTITATSYSQEDPKIYGNIVVWDELRNGIWQVYMKNLSTGTISALSPTTETQLWPDINGNNIVWTDLRNNGLADIYLKNISTGVVTNLTNDSNYQTRPAISNKYVVWIYDSNNDGKWENWFRSVPNSTPSGDTTPPTTNASPKGNTYSSGAISITLSMNESGKIYYTTNGNDPTTSSSIYSSPIQITHETILKFMAVDTAGNKSPIYTEEYLDWDAFKNAIGNSQSDFTRSYNGLWYAINDSTALGSTSIRSGPLGNSQESYIKTTFTGPGNILFDWKVSSESGYDFLKFYVDGVLKSSISGSVNWQTKMFYVGSGTHTLVWKYVKDGSASSGSDCGWIDLIKIESVNSLNSAVNNSNIILKTGGSSNWASASDSTTSDGTSARSGSIGNSANTTMYMYVGGTGTLKFNWKVSSESNYDFLELWIDGTRIDRISGIVNWTTKAYNIIKSGYHIIKWVYVKDGNYAKNSDCAWIDKIVWTPT